MVEAKNHQNQSSIYNFNGLGVLTSNIQNDITKDYIIDYTAPVPRELVELQGNLNIAYNYAGRSRLSTDVQGNTLYYHNDILGSARYLTDPTGTVRATTLYDEWGGVTKNKPYQSDNIVSDIQNCSRFS